MSTRYRVVSPFIAIKAIEDGYKIITLPSGCTFDMCGAVQKSGLIDVSFEGDTVAAFIRDIEMRAEPVT